MDHIIELVERSKILLNTESSFTDFKSDWDLISKQYREMPKHYLRKENQLFPYLERRGFSHPSSIMWSIHDKIRDIIKEFTNSVDENNEAKAKIVLSELLQEAFEMTVKEEKVLFPKSAKLLTKEDWIEIREGEDEIGWIINEPPKVWNEPKVEMGSYLNSDPKRLESIMGIISEFFDGKEFQYLEDRFYNELGGKISPGEFALAEQKMVDHGISDSQFEEKIDDLIKVFRSSLEKVTIENLEEGHPIDTFIKENDAIRKLVNELREEEKNVDLSNIDIEYWKKSYEKLWEINTHYLRKENQLFPYLEKKGFDKPSTVMWALHDDIRALIKYYRVFLDDKNYEELFETQELMFNAIIDMIFKEEKILWPTSLELINDEEWVEIRKGEDEVGYCLIETPPMWNPVWKHPSEAGSEVTHESNNTVKAKPFEAKQRSKPLVGGINLDVGAITPDQINLIFKHLPFDVTYVDEFDEVRFYNKGEERVFSRSPGIIGREVKYCHPPKSVHMVLQIVDAFKKGEKNAADFWINLGGKFIFIQYFAIRDEEGNYRGVLEITYDATYLRSLEGEKRLLDWELAS
jgi:hypothetical protein